MSNLEIGMRLKELRIRNNMSQEAFGDALGKNSTSIGRYEKAQMPVPADVLEKLAVNFNISLDYIILGNSANLQNSMHILTSEEQELLSLYNQLSHQDQRELLEYICFKLSRAKKGNTLDKPSPSNIDNLLMA